LEKVDIEQPKTVRLFKSEMCRAFLQYGTCKFGLRCQFAHGKEELREAKKPEHFKTKRCKKFYEDGICPYGSRCLFIHNERAFDSESDEMVTPTLSPSPLHLNASFDKEDMMMKNVFESPALKSDLKMFTFKSDYEIMNDANLEKADQLSSKHTFFDVNSFQKSLFSTKFNTFKTPNESLKLNDSNYSLIDSAETAIF
jgi:hypothetical protein